MSAALTSMPDLKTQEAKLNATIALKQYQQAQDESCLSGDVVMSAMRVRSLMLSITNKMQNALMDAIENAHDETRTHYLMTDCLLDLMHSLSTQIDNTNTPLPEFNEYFKRGAKPRDLITVSQWADRNRWLESGTNLPGRWNTATTPYLREIMDDLSEHSPVRSVTFIKSSGVGGTEVMYNWVGYIMHHLQNKDLLCVVPTLELRERSLNPRLSKMMEETPVLKELVNKSTRNKANRGDLLEYGARARIIKAGANSPDSLRSDHLPYVEADEVDAFPWDVGGEGDPMTLIENRQRTFSRAKSYFVSTPTKDEASRIDILYKRSDMRRYHVPCPHCGEFQTLKFGGKDFAYGLKWKMSLPVDDEPAQVESVQYLCEHCGVYIDEGHKTEMLAKGRWIAERPSIKLHHGYHLNALYSPVGLGIGWRAIVEKWLQCQGDSSELKAFINTYLGEVFKEQGDQQDPAALIMRLEVYDNPSIAFKTAGVDVQKDRLEVTIDGWGKDEENWTLNHLVIPGDTAAQDVWDELDEVLRDAGVRLAAIDSGYNTSMVYAFCEKRKWCVAIKGVEGAGRPLIEDEKKRRARLRAKRKRGVHVEPLGVDQGKALVYSRLKITTPGPGYIHYPQEPDFDDEYFAQLAAEKLVTKMRGQRPILEWVKTRPRNEAIDCKVYSFAAMRLCAVDLSKYVIPTSGQATPLVSTRKPRRRMIARK